MKKKIIIIGGGIAGLSAGVYAQKCGFETTILESHKISGGNCTSWKRNGYLFEGGMHWLTGSGKNEPLHKMWRYVGALDDSVKVINSEPFMVYNYNGTPIKMYRNADETEKHLISLSPEDAGEIRRLTGYIRRVTDLSMPVFDLRGVRATKKTHPPLSLMLTAMSGLRLMKKLTMMPQKEFIGRFKHEGIRELFGSVTNEQSGIMPLVFTYATLNRGDGGFPEGGSLPFAARITKTYTDLGGQILYKTKADRVIVENGRAAGVMAGGKEFPADAVIVTSDTMAIDQLFEKPPKADWLDRMHARTKPTMCVFVSLGIDADLAKYPKNYIIKPNTPVKLADQTYTYLSLNNYAGDPVYSPKGKSAVTVFLGGDTWDFWKKAKAENRYDDEKKRIAGDICAAVTAQIPEASGKIEVIDVATPLTYERYCGNWKGSWMTEMLPDTKMTGYPAAVRGLEGVYFAGQRMMPPGGLPVALISGRTAVQYLCRDTDTLFISED